MINKFFVDLLAAGLLGIIIGLTRIGVGEAQSPPLELAALTVELWPEFDRPEVLVIHRAELAPYIQLPAEVSFHFPGYIDRLHAVAVERNGGLYSVAPETIAVDREGDRVSLTFSADSRQIHLEYYDAQILNRDNSNRQIDFRFSPDYSIGAARFQVQVPLQAEQFELSPPPSSRFTDENGFDYQVIEIAGLAPDDTVTIKATYSRTSDQPSVQLRTNIPSDAAIKVVTDAPPANSNPLPYILVGAGVLLFIFIGGYWLWSRSRPSALPGRVGPMPPVQEPATALKKPRGGSPAGDVAGYCHQCGTALRADSVFCHVCGAKQPKS